MGRDTVVVGEEYNSLKYLNTCFSGLAPVWCGWCCTSCSGMEESTPWRISRLQSSLQVWEYSFPLMLTSPMESLNLILVMMSRETLSWRLLNLRDSGTSSPTLTPPPGDSTPMSSLSVFSYLSILRSNNILLLTGSSFSSPLDSANIPGQGSSAGEETGPEQFQWSQCWWSLAGQCWWQVTHCRNLIQILKFSNPGS